MSPADDRAVVTTEADELDAPAPTRPTRNSRRRRQILEITARTVSQRGYHAASLDEIAEELGVTKAALYYYYAGKEELVAAALDLYASMIVERLERVVASDADPTTRLRQLIELQLEVIIRELPDVSPLFLNRDDWPEPIWAVVRGWRRRHDACFKHVIADGIELGEFAGERAGMTRHLMHGALISCTTWISADDLTAELKTALADRVLAMFRP